ncbi:hypothetical protein GCM10007049_03300 [Echinicola pacifica]|uniref:Glutamyl/glutaminyl-tRNA synthetase class Ib catalytic domain-containing protein n=1 Tax=Echinicola pacifica TaxID=346377 RepID=A0A918PMB7_9BACT|nr:tRNA glutamyl-Q synthetase [Echinicola pacifica]GGZ14715.1 hypothetical protein GCM10007049_03300 [Echinicola pacifica]
MNPFSPDITLTRIAPTPSGFLHIGNILSFVITHSIAQKHQAKIMLRIDDLDQGRLREEYLDDIFDCLDFLEIPVDLGPKNKTEFRQEYSQIHRFPLYAEAINQLKANDLLYACDCSRKKINAQSNKGSYPQICRTKSLPLEAENVNWRLKTDNTAEIQIIEENQPFKSILPAQITDFVIRKKDKSPSYQLASLVDDIHFGTNIIIRGKDLYDSTLAQLYLSELIPANSFHSTNFHHHDLVKAPSGRKLSKSEGASSIKTMRESGQTKQAIYRQLGQYMGFQDPIGNLTEFIQAYHSKK